MDLSSYSSNQLRSSITLIHHHSVTLGYWEGAMDPLLMTSAVAVIIECGITTKPTNVALALNVDSFHMPPQRFGIEETLSTLIAVKRLVGITRVATQPVVLKLFLQVKRLGTIVTAEPTNIDPC